MAKKLFQPVVTRIKLTPEQAVLTCCDYATKANQGGGGRNCWAAICGSGTVAETSS